VIQSGWVRRSVAPDRRKPTADLDLFRPLASPNRAFRHTTTLEPHARRRKCLFDRLLNLVKGGHAERGDDDGGRAGQ
jgi:hypothetical protein